ncbi:helix-turn-helix domain-containing protein [Streptomyces sp. NPDC004609]|uniref:helix-turn-helix domain-containing protein n=1 Tax=Streptomyces sp. NPDC004609 TaxID=3364704 RepID=UPI0036C85CB2
MLFWVIVDRAVEGKPMPESDRTAELVRAAARALLGERLGRIVDKGVQKTIEDEPSYTGGPVSRDDLRFHMDRSMRLALARLEEDPLPPDLESAALDIGATRARQGIPLASVLHAFRIDLRTLWEALIDESREIGAEQRAEFLERSSLMVWEAVERNAEEVVRGYRMAKESIDEIRSAAFDQLLLDGDRHPPSVENAARALDLPASGRYVCVVGTFTTPRPELVAECATRLEARGLPFYFSWFAQELRGAVHVPTHRDNLADELSPLREHVCSTAEADGLRNVARAIRLARMAVRGRTEPGLQRLDQSWLNAVAAADPELSEALHLAVFAPLAALSRSERTGILETVGDLVSHGGTIAQIAERTYRHRNTVRARLRSFTELTGLDLSTTKDLATTAIAFAIDALRRKKAA